MDFKNIQESYSAQKDASDQNSFHFYYNREERLKNAPQIVRDYYEGKMNPKKGLLRVLVSNRQNKFLFLSIFIFAAFIWIFSFINGHASDKFLGSECQLEAFSFDDTVYVSLKMEEVKQTWSKNNKRKSLPQSAADLEGQSLTSEGQRQIPFKVTFYAYDNSGLVQNKSEIQEVFTGSELFVRTKFNDYDIIKVTAFAESEFESKEFSEYIRKR